MSNNIDLGNQSSGGIEIPLTSGAGTGDEETTGVQKKGYSQQDTIEESRDIIIALIPLLAEFPILKSGLLDPDAFAAVFFKTSGIVIDFKETSKNDSENDNDRFSSMLNATRVILENLKKNNEAINEILDKWNESIHKLNEEYDRMLQSPAYQLWKEMASPTYENNLKVEFPYVYNILIANSSDLLASLNAEQRGAEVDKIARREIGMRNYIDGMVDTYTQYKTEGDPRAIMLPIIISFATIDIGLSHSIVEKVAESSVGQSLEAVKTALPAQLVDTAVITINLFAASITLTTTFDTIFNAASKGNKPITKEMAENFAKEVIVKISGNEINGSLLLLLQNKIFGSEVTHERIAQLVAIAKVMMALQALILLYKADTKWITAEELAALLKGKIPLEQTSLAYQLVTLINFYRSQLSPALQVAILSSMMAYAESKNRSKDEDAFNTLKVVQDALDTELFDTFGIKG